MRENQILFLFKVPHWEERLSSKVRVATKRMKFVATEFVKGEMLGICFSRIHELLSSKLIDKICPINKTSMIMQLNYDGF